MKHMVEKIAANPSGILMYHAPGRPFAFGRWLGIEFGTELLQATLIALLLAQTRIVNFAGRVGFVVVAGILAAITTNVSSGTGTGSPLFTRRVICPFRSSVFSCRNCWRGHLAKARGPLTRIARISHEAHARSVLAGPSRSRILLQLCHRCV